MRVHTAETEALNSRLGNLVADKNISGIIDLCEELIARVGAMETSVGKDHYGTGNPVPYKPADGQW
jgi:hypothetical protein